MLGPTYENYSSNCQLSLAKIHSYGLKSEENMQHCLL